MTLDTPHFTTLSDALHDRTANTDVALDYGRDRVTSRRDDPSIVTDIELKTFAVLHGKDSDDLRIEVLRHGESWPPRRVWFQGYAAAHDSTLALSFDAK